MQILVEIENILYRVDGVDVHNIYLEELNIDEEIPFTEKYTKISTGSFFKALFSDFVEKYKSQRELANF